MERNKEITFLDTNAVVWLSQGELEKFPRSLLVTIEEKELFISPIVKLELQYLYEIERVKTPAKKIMDYLYETIGIVIHNVPLNLLIEESIKQDWTRDPFDRLIVSHAKIEGSELVTRDQTILKNYPKAIWD